MRMPRYSCCEHCKRPHPYNHDLPCTLAWTDCEGAEHEWMDIPNGYRPAAKIGAGRSR